MKADKTNKAAKNTKAGRLADRLVILRQNFTRKDIADWQAAINQTFAAEPKWVKLQELYTSLMLDAHLFSQIALRKNRVLGLSYAVRSGDKDVEIDAFDELLRDNISQALDSLFFGYSIVELDFPTLRTDCLDRRNFDPRNHLFYADPSSSQPLDYRLLPQFGKTLLEYNSGTNGILEQATPHVLFKRFAQSCWSELCEIYGMPPRYIKTNTQDQELIARYEQMLSNLGSGASYILDLDDEMGFADTNATDGAVYNNLITLCKNELSTLVCGAVLGQDTSYGSNAKEQASQDLLQSLTESDKRYVSSCLNSSLLPALALQGLIPEDARFEFLQQENTSELFAQTMQAANFFDIDPAWVKEKFGIEVLGARSFASDEAQPPAKEDKKGDKSTKNSIDFFA